MAMENFKMETTKKKIYDTPPNDFYKEEENWSWDSDLSNTASRELGEKCIEIISDYVVNRILDALK